MNNFDDVIDHSLKVIQQVNHQYVIISAQTKDCDDIVVGSQNL